MRSLPAGIDQRSPARHPDWLGPDDLSLKIQEIREATDYQIPIQLKLGAARVYDDVRMAAKCGPDIIYLDGAEGGTGAGPHIATEETGIPLMAAIPEARRALEDVGLADEIDLVVAGGIRNGGDVAKALALGAKAVAIGHSALMALNCNKEIPGVTDYEGTIGVPGRPVLPLPHRPLPGRHHDAGSRAAQAPRRRRGRRARLQLPAHAHARGADAGARVRQDQHPQPRARGPVRAHGRGRRDGEGAAGRDELHPRRHRAARRSTEIKSLLERQQDEESTEQVPTAARRAGGGGLSDGDSAAEPERRRRDRRRVRSPATRFPYQEDTQPGRGRRPPGRHARRGHQLARGRRAARGGRRPRRLRPLLERVPQDLLRDPGGARGRDRPQGADQAPAVGQLVRHPAEGEHCKFPQPELGPWVRGLTRPSAPTGSRRCSRAGSRRRTSSGRCSAAGSRWRATLGE